MPTGSVWSVKLVEAGPGPKDRFLPNSYSRRSPVHSTTQGNTKVVIALTITCHQHPKGKFTAQKQERTARPPPEPRQKRGTHVAGVPRTSGGKGLAERPFSGRDGQTPREEFKGRGWAQPPSHLPSPALGCVRSRLPLPFKLPNGDKDHAPTFHSARTLGGVGLHTAGLAAGRTPGPTQPCSSGV